MNVLKLVTCGRGDYMSPVSPVFHTKVTVSIGIKNELRFDPFHNIVMN